MKIFDSLSGLVNLVTGTGTRRDKITHVSWHFDRPADQVLSNLYRSTWVARKMVDIPIDDMLREGWTWNADPADLTLLEEEEKRLNFHTRLREVLTRDSIYGGGAFIIGSGSDHSQPLVADSMRKGGIEYLLVTGRGELAIDDLVVQPGKDYGRPAMYSLQTMGGTQVKVHPSRVVPFIGMPVTAPLGVIKDDDFWGDSRLASVMRDIAAAMSGVAGTGRLMDELAITYHKITGLTERLAEVDGAEAVARVLSLMSQTKSSINSVAIDAEDDVNVITASFAGLPEAVRSLMQNVSGAADIPLTRFLGSSPDGMNATGASDIRNYYDRLAGRRKAYIVSPMEALDKLLIRSALGRADDSVWRKWHPLWQMTEAEQVEVDDKKFTMFGKIAQSGMVHDHVMGEVAKATMVDSPTFPGAEKAFEEAKAMPDPEPDEVETANSLQAGGGQRPPVGKPQLRVVGDSGSTELWSLEDVKAWMSQPRHPAGTRKGGQFAGGPSAALYGPQMLGGAGGADQGRSITGPINKSKEIDAAIDVRGFTEDDEFVLVAYTGQDYKWMNPALRKGEHHKKIDAMDEAISKGTLTENRQFLRGIDSFEAIYGKKPEVGVVVKEAGFMSVTPDATIADKFSRGDSLVVIAPKGMNALPTTLNPIDRGAMEKEVILPRGLSMKVVSVAEDGKITVELFDDKRPFIPDGWSLEDVKAWMSQPRHPAGTGKGGQWSGGASQSNYGPQMTGGSSAASGASSGGLSVANAFNKVDEKKCGEIYRSRILPSAGVKEGDPETKLSDADYALIGSYSQIAYIDINNALRSGKVSEAAESAISKGMESVREYEYALNSSLEKLPPHTGVVYRGASFITRSGAAEAFESYRSATGSEIVEKAFVSSSKSPSAAREGEIKFSIKSKAGRDISRLSLKGTSEQEVLFRSNTKFKVLRSEIIREGREYFVELEEV